MAKAVTVRIAHDLGKAEARRRIAEGFGTIEEQLSGGGIRMSFQERWEDDRLYFTGGTFGQTVRGQVDVRDDVVLVEVTLPTLLAAVAETLKGKIERQGTKLLEHKA